MYTNGKPKDEAACNGRRTKAPKRYKIETRLQGENWVTDVNSFAELQDALDYASMLSCYPVIYGMARVVDNHRAVDCVMQTFGAGEGQLKPKVNPWGPRFSVQLRYTVSPKGETWGWLSKQFYSHGQALAFTRVHLFPRKICDVVRIYHGDEQVGTHYSVQFPNDTCSRPCTRDTNGDGGLPAVRPLEIRVLRPHQG